MFQPIQAAAPRWRRVGYIIRDPPLTRWVCGRGWRLVGYIIIIIIGYIIRTHLSRGGYAEADGVLCRTINSRWLADRLFTPPH